MLSMRIPYFNLNNIYNSKQLCLMKKLDDTTLIVYSKEKVLMMKQFGGKIVFHCSDDEFFNYWYYFLSLDKPYNKEIFHLKKMNLIDNDEFDNYSNVRPFRIDLESLLVNLCCIDDIFFNYNLRSCLEPIYESIGEKIHVSIPNFGKATNYLLPELRKFHKLKITGLPKAKLDLLNKVSETVETMDLSKIQKLEKQLAYAWLKGNFPCLKNEHYSHIMFSCFGDYSFCPEYYLKSPIKKIYNVESNSFKEWYDAELDTNIGLFGIMLSSMYHSHY